MQVPKFHLDGCSPLQELDILDGAAYLATARWASMKFVEASKQVIAIDEIGDGACLTAFIWRIPIFAASAGCICWSPASNWTKLPVVCYAPLSSLLCDWEYIQMERSPLNPTDGCICLVRQSRLLKTASQDLPSDLLVVVWLQFSDLHGLDPIRSTASTCPTLSGCCVTACWVQSWAELFIASQRSRHGIGTRACFQPIRPAPLFHKRCYCLNRMPGFRSCPVKSDWMTVRTASIIYAFFDNTIMIKSVRYGNLNNAN